MKADRPDRIPGEWHALSVRIPADREDEVLGLLYSDDVLGLETRTAGRSVAVTAWFADEVEARRAEQELNRHCGDVIGACAVRSVRDDGWLDGAGPRPVPVRAGRFVIIDAESASDSRDDARLADRVQVFVPRSRAFGTGEHETTQMCLELLDAHLREHDAVLDLGCGSGILGIAAALGGAAQVVALDDDPLVEDVALENFLRNGVGPVVAWRQGSWTALREGETFDLALANIHRTALERGARRIGQHMVCGSVVILSGFVEADAERVAAAWMKHGGRVLTTMTHPGPHAWAALAIRIAHHPTPSSH